MSLEVPLKSDKAFEPVKAGTHLARCVNIIEIGTTSYLWKGAEVSSNKVRLVFELPEEKFENEDGTANAPLISVEYSLSMGSKAKLRGFIERWIGASLLQGEAVSFDLKHLLGQPCIITVAHKTKGEKTYADIVSAAPLMKGMKCPEALHTIKELTYKNWDEAFFLSLPEWLRTKMQSTPEYQNRVIKQEYEANGIPFD